LGIVYKYEEIIVYIKLFIKMGIIFDWDSIVRSESNYNEKERIKKYINDYCFEHNPLLGRTKVNNFNWLELIQNLPCPYLEPNRIFSFGFDHKFLLSFGYPERNYNGPIKRETRNCFFYLIEDEDEMLKLRVGINGDYSSYVGTLLNDPSYGLDFLEPKLFTLMRESKSSQFIEGAVSGFIINYLNQEDLEC